MTAPDPQPPAAPETDVSARLVAHPEPGKVWVQIPHRNDIGSDWIAVDELPSPDLDAARERVRVVEGERDAWKARRDAAVEQCRHLHQDGKTREQWHLDNCGAMRALRLSRDTATNALEALAESGAETLSAQCDADDLRSRLHLATARAESAEAANEALRKELLALAEDFASNVDWSSGRSNYGDNEAWESAARQVRALVGGAS